MKVAERGEEPLYVTSRPRAARFSLHKQGAVFLLSAGRISASGCFFGESDLVSHLRWCSLGLYGNQNLHGMNKLATNVIRGDVSGRI